MRRPFPLIAAAAVSLLALAGCGSLDPEARRTRILLEGEGPQQRACREEARRSPEVRAFDRQANPQRDAFYYQEEVERGRQVAEARVFRDCLRRAGLPMPGGVEPIIPR